VSLYILLSLKKCLSERISKCKGKEETKSQQPAADILSVNQQKTIRTCLQFVISMGVLPSLLPGVGISLAARSTSTQKLKVEELVILEVH
jgi:putative exporter of polyketide antibiotics